MMDLVLALLISVKTQDPPTFFQPWLSFHPIKGKGKERKNFHGYIYIYRHVYVYKLNYEAC